MCLPTLRIQNMVSARSENLEKLARNKGKISEIASQAKY